MRSEPFYAAIRFHKLFFGAITLALVLNLISLAWIKKTELSTMPQLLRAYEEKRRARLPERPDALQSRMKKTREDILRFAGSLPHKLMIAEAMQEILELLTRNGLPTVNMSFLPESTDFPGLIKYGTSFGVNGKYGQVKSLLADIQNSKSLFCIEGLALANQAQEVEAVSLNLRLTLYLRSSE